MDMDMEEFKETFLAELRETIISLNEILIKLEETPTNLDLVEGIMRIAHTLKGMSATMNYEPITKVCHEVEGLLEKVSKGGLVDSAVLNVLFRFVDTLEDFSQLIGAGKQIDGAGVEDLLNLTTSVDDFMITLGQKFHIVIKFSQDCKLRGPRSLVILNNLEKIANIIKTDPSRGDLEKGMAPGDLTIEIVSNEEEAMIYQAIKSVQDVESVELSLLTEGVSSTLAPGRDPLTALTVRISLRDLDHLMNLVGELVIVNGILEEMLHRIGSMEVFDTLSKIKSNVLMMQDIIMKMRMVSVDHVFGRFPRMIRDIAAAQNKEIEFITRGGYTQVDRTLIEHLHEPLVHLIRNAASHGIEDVKTRQKLGKNPRGTVILTAHQEQSDVLITVEDDGRGIDLDAVKAAAVARNLIPKAAALSQEKLLELLFSSHFSTSKDVSEVSGRGLGLAVVQENVSQAGGTVTVDTEPGKGTTFSMRFPLITPISSVLLAQIDGMVLAFPLTNVSQILTVSPDQILMNNGQSAIIVRKKQIPILDLRQKLLYPSPNSDSRVKGGSAIIWEKGSVCVALLIDEVQRIEEVVIKKPDAVLSNIQGVSGATIISGGDIALIIDPLELIDELETGDKGPPEKFDEKKGTVPKKPPEHKKREAPTTKKEEMKEEKGNKEQPEISTEKKGQMPKEQPEKPSQEDTTTSRTESKKEATKQEESTKKKEKWT